MAMITCPDCGNAVSDQVSACPKCGRSLATLQNQGAPTTIRRPQGLSPKQKTTNTRLAIIIVGILMIGGFCLIFKHADIDKARGKKSSIAAAPDLDQAPSYSTPSEPSEFSDSLDLSDPSEPPLEVSARQLYYEYQANESAADNKYKGKTLLVTGAVTDIRSDFSGNPMVLLRVGNQLGTVMASFPGNGAGAEALSQGRYVTMECRCQGVVAGSPKLDGCAVK